MKLDNHYYYCYCPVCNNSDKAYDFFVKADSLQEAKENLQIHEKDLHKGKPVGTFGVTKKDK